MKPSPPDMYRYLNSVSVSCPRANMAECGPGPLVRLSGLRQVIELGRRGREALVSNGFLKRWRSLIIWGCGHADISSSIKAITSSLNLGMSLLTVYALGSNDAAACASATRLVVNFVSKNKDESVEKVCSFVDNNLFRTSINFRTARVPCTFFNSRAFKASSLDWVLGKRSKGWTVFRPP